MFVGCTAQQESEVIPRPGKIGKPMHIFIGLQTKCAGLLSAISIHVKRAGTVYVDLWKETDSGTDHVLYFTKGITVSGRGKFTVPINEVVYVEEGLTYGTHRPESDVVTYVLEDGITNPNQQKYEALVFSHRHEDIAWTPNVLHRSHLTQTSTKNRRPSMAVHIGNTDVQSKI